MITPLAFLSGMFASMLFMILGWPLANLLSLTRVLFDSFQMKLVLAAAIGVASAPVAENHAPAIQKVVSILEQERQNIPQYIDRLSDRLP